MSPARPSSCCRVLLVFALLVVSPPPAVLAADFSRLVIFGDSLSDAGNHFIAFHTTSHQPFVPDPEASYAIGGHHFSNGATWAQQLATALHLPTSGKPALRAPGVFTNYAVGRARARPDAPVFPFFDFATQVNRFLSDFGGVAPSDALYVVWFGANDLTDALTALQGDPSGATSAAIIQAAVTAIATNIQALWAAGARSFLVLNLPNFAVTPLVRSLGPAAELAATLQADAFNAGLDQALAQLGVLPGTQFVRLDINALFDAVVAAPRTVGLTNVDDACLTFFVTGHVICRTPNRYLFWDGIHPTRTGHDIIADAALAALTAP